MRTKSIPRVQVVIVNWRRPSNLPRIIKAFRNQTVPCWLTVCDVGGKQHRLPEDVLVSLDSWFVWDINHGGFNRLIPAFAYPCEYCWFHDDDMVPGPHLLEFLLSWSHLPFAVMGQTGRRVVGQEYRVVEPSKHPEEVDFVCRGYFVRTSRLPHILRYTHDVGLARDFILEEDILMAAAIQANTGEKAWITPRSPPGAEMNARELPAPHACQDMPDHYGRRIAFFNMCRTMTRHLHRTPARIILLGTPSGDCRNLISHARSLGIRAWLQEQFPDFPIIAPDTTRHDLARFEIADEDLIVCQAEEALGEAVLLPTGSGNGILRQFGRNRVIILSKSFPPPSDTDGVHLALTQRHYAEHPRLTLIAADAHSQELARQWFPTVDVAWVVPDFALNFPVASPAGTPVGEHVLVSVCTGRGVVRNLDSVVGKLTTLWDTINFEETEVTEGVRLWMLQNKIAEIQRAAALITNHLDGLLFAYLARSPTVILPNEAPSLMSVAEWFQKVPWIRVAPSLAEIPQTLAAVRLASKHHEESLSQEFTNLAGRLRLAILASNG